MEAPIPTSTNRYSADDQFVQACQDAYLSNKPRTAAWINSYQVTINV